MHSFLSKAFYYAGHIVSLLNIGWLYPVYNWFMIKSVEFDNGSVWKKGLKDDSDIT